MSDPSSYTEQRSARLRRTAILIGPFALLYKDLAATVSADLERLSDADLGEAKTLGFQAFHGDPADMPFEVMEVGRVVEVQAAILLNQRVARRRA